MDTKILSRVVLGMSFVIATPLFAEELPSFQLTTKDGRFSPEKIEIPAGKKIKLVVRNEGSGPEEFESHDLNREKMVMPGKSVEIFIGPLKPGVYGFYGEFNPKTATGQIIAK